MYAFIALILNFVATGPTGTTGAQYASRANSIADSLIAAKPTVLALSSTDRNKVQREHGEMAAQIYDWNFPQLGSTRRSALYSLIFDYADDLASPSDSEYLWGVAHGDLCYAGQMLCTILADSTSSTTNDQAKAILDLILEGFDPGPAVVGQKQLGYFPVFRYFGQDDGGTHKGCGPGGYDTIQSEFYCRLMHTLRTALLMDVMTTEAWFRRATDWKLWHYRCDINQHRQNEHLSEEAFSHFTQSHAYLSASITADTSEKNRWRWYAEQIDASQSGHMDRGYNLWRITWDQKIPLTPTTPTLADTNGGNSLKFFSKAGITIWREGWSTTDLSAKMISERFFTGDHEKRGNGSLEVAHNGAPMIIQGGSYGRPLQSRTYKWINTDGTLNAEDETGHRRTYAQRILAQSVCRIFSSSEPSTNALESFQRTTAATGASSSRFGVRTGTSDPVISNDGGQLWKKSGSLIQPGNLGDIVGDVSVLAFVVSPAPYPLPGEIPIETSAYAYQVTDISGSYWSTKRTRYRRHVLYIKSGQIPSWSRPIIMIWDDLVTPSIDGTAGNKTQVQQWQSCRTSPTGSAGTNFEILRSAAAGSLYPHAPEMAAKLFIKVINPACSSAIT